MARASNLLTIAGCVAALTACGSVETTDPPRTATEQFLLSVAASEAVAQLPTAPLQGKRVYIEDHYVALDQPMVQEQRFMVAELRAHLLEGDVRLVPERDDADVVVEVFSGGIGIDSYATLVGLPMELVLAMAGTVPPEEIEESSPELAIYRESRQWGAAGVNYVAYWTQTGDVLAAAGPAFGRSWHERLRVLIFTDRDSNIPPSLGPKE